MTIEQDEVVPGEAFAEGSVVCRGFGIRYKEAGTGEPVVWIHGAGGLALSPVHDRLARDRRVVAIEMPGWGIEPSVAIHSAADAAAVVGEAIAELGLEHCHLWGTSLGATVAMHLALGRPSLPQTLVLESPSAFRRGSPELAAVAAMSAEARARAFNRHPERVSRRPNVMPDPERLALIARVRGPDHDDQLELRLADLSVPTLVLFGTHDAIVAPESGRIYRARLEHCALAYVYDAAHDLQGDRPEAVADIIGDFFEHGLGFGVEYRDPRINP